MPKFNVETSLVLYADNEDEAREEIEEFVSYHAGLGPEKVVEDWEITAITKIGDDDE